MRLNQALLLFAVFLGSTAKAQKAVDPRIAAEAAEISDLMAKCILDNRVRNSNPDRAAVFDLYVTYTVQFSGTDMTLKRFGGNTLREVAEVDLKTFAWNDNLQLREFRTTPYDLRTEDPLYIGIQCWPESGCSYSERVGQAPLRSYPGRPSKFIACGVEDTTARMLHSMHRAARKLGAPTRASITRIQADQKATADRAYEKTLGDANNFTLKCDVRSGYPSPTNQYSVELTLDLKRSRTYAFSSLGLLRASSWNEIERIGEDTITFYRQSRVDAGSGKETLLILELNRNSGELDGYHSFSFGTVMSLSGACERVPLRQPEVRKF